MSAETKCLQLAAPISFQRVFVDWTGSIGAALMLSQLAYWTRQYGWGVWIYKTSQDWESDLGLKIDAQATARARLKKAGLVMEKLKGVPPKLHFQINQERFMELLLQSGVSTQIDLGSLPKTNWGKTPYSISKTTSKTNNSGGKAPSTNVGFLKTDDNISPFVKKTVAKLEDFIRLSRRLDRRFNRQKWYREIELLLQEVDGDKKRIIKALRAYIELIDIKECRPIIDSASSFREKFDKVERYVEKYEHVLPPEPVASSSTLSKPLTKEAKETIARLRASLNNE